MKKIGLLTREKIIDDVTARAKDSQNFFFITFNKINAFAVNTLRNELKKSGAKVVVAKNSLFKRAFKDLGYKDYDDLVNLETGLIFVNDQDVVSICKLIANFSKENENFQIKGGYLRKEKLDPKQLLALAKLPSREVLLAMVVGSIASPLTSFHNLLNQIILKFAWAIKALQKKREKEPQKLSQAGVTEKKEGVKIHEIQVEQKEKADPETKSEEKQ